MSNTQDDNQYTDDFSDDSYETQDESLDNGENSDEWDDGDYAGDDGASQDDGGEGNAETPKKKKSSLSTIIIIAVAVIGCLGFVVLKFGGTTAPATEVEQVDNGANGTNESGDTSSAATTPATGVVPTPSTDVVDATPDTQGFMMAPEKVENIVIKEPEPPPIETPPKEPEGQPADISQLPAGDNPDAKSADNPATPDLAAGTTSPAEFPTVATILKPQPDTKETPPDMGASTPESLSETPSETTLEAVAAPAPVDNNTGETVAAASVNDVKTSKEYQEVSKNLDLANQKIAELEQKIADQAKMATPETTDNSIEVAALQEKIATLQKKLQAQSSRSAQQYTSAVQGVVKKQPKSKAHATHYQTPSRWTLRSASPGKAILYNQTTNESKSVRVGDNVPSIGSITSIEKVAGQWVIKGTSGQVSR